MKVTSGVKRAAAKRCGYSRLWLSVIWLDDDLVSLHQSLADKLLKHLRCTHYWSFIFTPEEQIET